MSQRRPVETELGVLRGRDCIFLASVEFEDGTNTLVLRGEINGNLCSDPRPGRLVPYVLTFRGVLAVRMLELDSWTDQPASAFDEVPSAEWIEQLGGKVTLDHRHFAVQTYDDVFDIVCAAYSLKLTEAA